MAKEDVSRNDRSESIQLPATLEKEVRRCCAETNTPVAALVEFLLQQWLADGAKPPFEHDVVDDDEHGQEARFFFATRLFLETMPFEITIKALEGDEIRYLWANSLFRNMAGGLELKDIAHKTNREVWAHNPARAQQVEKWDREILEKGEAFAHLDTLVPGHSIERPRVGVRFPLSFSRTDIHILGSIGIDFATKDVALEAERNIRLAGNWQATKLGE